MSTQSEFVRASMIVRKAWAKVYALANAEAMPGFPIASALHILRTKASHMEEAFVEFFKNDPDNKRQTMDQIRETNAKFDEKAFREMCRAKD